MSAANQILKLTLGKNEVVWTQGIFDGIYPGNHRAIVRFDDGRVPAHLVASARPAAGAKVWICIIDDVVFFIGATAPGVRDGVVVAFGDDIATVTTDIDDLICIFPYGAQLWVGAFIGAGAGGIHHPHPLRLFQPLPQR